MKRYILEFISPSLFLIAVFPMALVGQDNLDRGISIYNSGDFTKASRILKNAPLSPRSMYYLGMSLEKLEDKNGAANAYTMSVNECYRLLIDLLSKLPADGADGVIKKQIDLHELAIEDSIRSAQNFQRLRPEEAKVVLWENKVIIIRMFSKTVSNHEQFFAKGSIQPIRLVTKPGPNFAALRNEIRENRDIHVLIGFLRNGQIGFAIPYGAPADKITEAAVIAAKKVEFEPASIDGIPISQVKTILYKLTIK
ncbi:MAG: hypothetical protein R2681_13330 [Pyrinomonadaceae bacterium]